MKTQRAQGLRRKARRLNRQADINTAGGRVWDAAQQRDRAKALEAQADYKENLAFDPDADLGAGFRDMDLEFETVSLNPRDWS